MNAKLTLRRLWFVLVTLGLLPGGWSTSAEAAGIAGEVDSPAGLNLRPGLGLIYAAARLVVGRAPTGRSRKC